jgi:hypothetical protein
MAQVSPAYCADMQTKHNLAYWRVMDKSKKLVINRNSTSSNLDASISDLSECLEACIGDCVFVTLYEFKPEKTTDASSKGKSFDLMVKINDPYTNTGSHRQNISGAPSFTDLLNLHSKIQSYEIEKIKSQYEAASESKESAIDKLINKLLEGEQLNTLVTLLLSKAMKPAVVNKAISAPENTELQQAFTKLEAVDPDYKHTLIKMAEYLHTNPAVLPQIKAIIGA